VSEMLVIGAGAIGLTTALAALEAQATVTVLERGAAGQEASWAGGGILSPLCPWDYPDAVTRLALRGMAHYEELVTGLKEATGVDPEYRRCGMRVLPPFDAGKARDWCAAHGMRCEEDGEALLLPEVAQVRNPRLLRAMRERVRQLGGRIVEQCEVQRLVVQGGRVCAVETRCGRFEADSYVLAAGAWNQTLLGGLAGQLEIRPIRGQMLLFRFDVPPLPHILLQRDLYVIPRADGHLLVGSTLEDAGFDKSVTDEALRSLWQRASTLLPALQGKAIERQWAGLRPGSPGNVPTIGRHPALNNLYLNGGHFRYGVTMAPAAAEVLLNMMRGRPQPFDIAPYRWR